MAKGCLIMEKTWKMLKKMQNTKKRKNFFYFIGHVFINVKLFKTFLHALF